jgi:hypothetical protein
MIPRQGNQAATPALRCRGQPGPLQPLAFVPNQAVELLLLLLLLLLRQATL